jgi:thioesterase domain-containing protein
MGGVVAYEMAQQLVAAGQRVPVLALLETWRPLPARHVLPLRFRRASMLRLAVGRMLLYARTLWHLERAERLHYLKTRLTLLREAVATRDPFRGDQRELYLSLVAQANLGAFRRYVPRPYPGRVIVFTAEDRRVRMGTDRRVTWRELVTAMETFTVPGHDSGSSLIEPHVQVLAEHLERYLVPDGSEDART